jgi:glycosyltransferase involved in cell wall biosynthesis
VLPAPDVVVGSSVHPFAAWAGARLANRFGASFIFEIRDLWPQTLIDMGRFKSYHPMALALGWLERFLCRKACRVVTLLPNADLYLRAIGVSSDRISWVPNGVDVTDEGPLPLSTNTGPFSLMYFGAHGSANGLENALRAMEILQNEMIPVHLRLIGDGPEKARLTQLAKEMALSNVSFEPPVRKSEIPSLASEADAFVFNLIDAPVFKYGISSNKLFDYMSAQRPVIFCCDSSNNPVMDAGAGVTVRPGQPEALAEAIRAMVRKTPEERAVMGLAGRRHVQAHYSYRKLAEKFSEILDACVVNSI